MYQNADWVKENLRSVKIRLGTEESEKVSHFEDIPETEIYVGRLQNITINKVRADTRVKKLTDHRASWLLVINSSCIIEDDKPVPVPYDKWVLSYAMETDKVVNLYFEVNKTGQGDTPLTQEEVLSMI